MKTAIILGATGVTGGFVLQYLLADENCSLIKVFTRRSLEMEHPKIEEHVLDLFELEAKEKEFTADEVYCCIGSTKSKTPDEEVYRKVDHGIPVSAAKLAKKNRIGKFLVVSALGSDPDSRFFYNKTKGEMERDVLKQNLGKTYFFRPSLIAGERKEKRVFESLGKQIMKVGNHVLVGPLRKYRSIHPSVIAQAMIYVASYGHTETIIESDEIKKLAGKKEEQQNGEYRKPKGE